MEKKVFLYAYDKINFGDDLFVRNIVRRYPNVQFYIWSEKINRITFKDLPNLTVIDSNSFFVNIMQRVRKSLVARFKRFIQRRCTAVVYIGGSIFIEYDNWEHILSWWNYEAENFPFYVLGANFGPYKNEAFKEAFYNVFTKVKDICFRDTYSYDLFKDCLTVRYASDILFMTDLPKTQLRKRQVFFSIINCKKKEEGKNNLQPFANRYIQNMIKLVEEYTKNDYSVLLVSFCNYEGDEEAILEILDHMDKQKLLGKVNTLFYNGTNTDDILEELAHSEYVIASRFHALILGIAAGKAVFPIIYSDKTISVLYDIGFQGNWADIRANNEIEFDFSISNLLNNIFVPNTSLKKDSDKHFIYLDKVLK